MNAWDFALKTWARSGVADVCLELQNAHGQCPPLWLWRLWAVTSGRPVPADTLTIAIGATQSWQASVVDPLRAVRVGLKTAAPPFADAAREALRAQVRAAELSAERLLIDTLDGLTPPSSMADPAASATPAVFLALGEAWGHAVPPALIFRFLALALGDELDREGRTSHL